MSGFGRAFEEAQKLPCRSCSDAGLTLGYGIYIREGHESNRLLSHECRHVQRYEAAGSIRDFLPSYLAQIVQYGYHDAPYEADARAHEIDTA